MTNDDGATPASSRVPDSLETRDGLLTAFRHSHIFRICG